MTNTSHIGRLQESLEAESHQLQKLISDVNERAKATGEALVLEVKERTGSSAECMKFASHTKEQLEREINDRKLRDDEAERQMAVLAMELERERNERDREDVALRAFVTGVKHELTGEREDRVAEVAAMKRVVHALEGQVVEDIRDLKQNLDTEMRERSAADARFEKQHADLKAATDTDRTNTDAATSALEIGLRTVRQAHEQEEKERVAGEAETNRNLADIANQLAHCSAELINEKADRNAEVGAVRGTIHTFDKQVAMKFQELEDMFKMEIGTRNDYNSKFEKRFYELRSAVLIAVRGGSVKALK